ncbi:MAG: tRNA pseudouridine(13) synthase TruD, partial [Myxococcota bacterium]
LQTLSIPPPCTPETVLALDLPGIAVLDARRHRHKLRTGHLRGNRFVLRLREMDVDAERGAAMASAILDRLAAAPGMPNWFGPQRFGRDGNNAEIGRALLTGDPLPDGMRRPRGRALRLFVSALQSELFNEYLKQRLSDGILATVLAGDLLQKTESGGLFASDDPATDQPRLAAGEVVPTGPMFGHKARQPSEGSAAHERESSLLAEYGLTTRSFARMGKLGIGTRRALAVRVHNATANPLAERAIELSFDLPAGSYATAVMREVVKGANPFPG